MSKGTATITLEYLEELEAIKNSINNQNHVEVWYNDFTNRTIYSPITDNDIIIDLKEEIYDLKSIISTKDYRIRKLEERKWYHIFKK